MTYQFRKVGFQKFEGTSVRLFYLASPDGMDERAAKSMVCGTNILFSEEESTFLSI